MPTSAEHLVVPNPTAQPSSTLDTHVRAIMRAGVISLPDDASLRQVQRALVAHRVHAVLVVSARTGEPVGWATARGVLQHALADASVLPAMRVVTEGVVDITPNATAEEALQRLVETGAARLLVRRSAQAPPQGVVSDLDLVRLTTPA